MPVYHAFKDESFCVIIDLIQSSLLSNTSIKFIIKGASTWCHQEHTVTIMMSCIKLLHGLNYIVKKDVMYLEKHGLLVVVALCGI
jgi:hypothetical protein